MTDDALGLGTVIVVIAAVVLVIGAVTLPLWGATTELAHSGGMTHTASLGGSCHGGFVVNTTDAEVGGSFVLLSEAGVIEDTEQIQTGAEAVELCGLSIGRDTAHQLKFYTADGELRYTATVWIERTFFWEGGML